VRVAVVTLVLLLSGCATVAAPPHSPIAWGEFGYDQPGLEPHITDTVKIGWTLERGTTKEIWIAERTRETRKGNDDRLVQTTRTWADSRTCPSLVPTLSKLAALDRFAVQPPGVFWPEGQDIAPDPQKPAQGHYVDHRRFNQTFSDAGFYSLTAPGAWTTDHWAGSATFKSGAHTPVADWINGAFESLQPCWRTNPPL
jgi:hypothetical protein